MASPRQKLLMQEALDDQLTPEHLRELHRQLDESPNEAAEYQRLKQVDRLLKSAPMESAPEGLALRVLARLAEGLQSQTMMRPSSLAVALGLALTALGLMPLLAILGYQIINAIGNAAALTALLHGMVRLLTMLAQTLHTLISSAQMMLQTYPEAPIVVVTLIPAALLWIWRASRTDRINT